MQVWNFLEDDSDNENHFDSKEFRELCEQFGIHKAFAVVYYPLSNGQTKVVNVIIKSILKARLEDKKII